MKKINIKSIFVLLLIFSFASCSQFEDMNIDPNKAQNVPTSALLTQAQANIVYNLNGEIAQLGAQYAQHFSQLEYPDKSNYTDNGMSSFSSIYRGGLRDLKEIIILNENDPDNYVEFGDNENQIAIAKVLSVWAFHSISDVWGDIPYTQAVSDDYLLPVYDTQESIYDGLVSDLKEAQSMMNMSPKVEVSGDLIFGGNMDLWYRFAESLKVRIGIRLTEVDETKAASILSEVDFSKTFNNSGYYAEFGHLETEAEANPLYIDNIVNEGGDYFVPSNTLIDELIATSDPRLSSIAYPSANNGEYIGHPYGLDDGGNAEDISLMNDRYVGQTSPTIIMLASEVLFSQAEAIQRGYISGDAALVFEEAIRASMEYNEVESSEIENYLATVAYDASNWQEQIGIQKWIALFGQGIQAWSEWRRLDYPVLTPGPGAQGRSIPRRRTYHTVEYSTNGNNVAEAVERLGGSDLFSVRIWWDK